MKESYHHARKPIDVKNTLFYSDNLAIMRMHVGDNTSDSAHIGSEQRYLQGLLGCREDGNA